ncbi:MAG: glycerophosphodiester phosphodiesterase [Rhodospirillales bacterium]|nr:glycerophosphodiester phosphodiesterase [Rhodospirillales bacterium]
MPTISAGVPRIIAHRGASGHAPENTLAAFRKAAELGASWVEFDAKLTRDNHAILMHDDDLERTTNGAGKVAQTDWADISHLDAGTWFADEFAGETVPTLSDTISTLSELGLGANVEIKPCPGRERETGHIVAAQLVEEWPDNIPVPLISSFSRESLVAAWEVAPRIPRAFLSNRIKLDWDEQLSALECNALHTNQKYLNAVELRQIHNAGYAVRVYTVNDPMRAKELFGWGVDGVITDYPDRMAAI